MAENVGIAVVGTGDWGANLVRNFAGLPGARLAAIHDSDPQRLKKTAAQYPGARATGSLEELLGMQDVQAAVVAASAASHHALAKALLEASNAGGPVLCPYCGVEIASPPRATGKCPACGEKVVMAKRPGEESRTPFTVEQAEGNKKALASARTRKKAIEHARGIGCTDSEFAAKEQELADKWGRPPSPNDVFWGLSNERLAKFPSFDKYSKWAELFRIYEHQTRVLVEEGRPHLDVAKKASEAFLHHLEDQCRFWGKEGVSIATRKDCCPECSRLGGQRLSIAEALETLPIPNEKCTNERCRCTWKADL